jgi:phosphoribosyl-AMP cyclohydrolase
MFHDEKRKILLNSYVNRESLLKTIPRGERQMAYLENKRQRMFKYWLRL